MDIKEKKKIVPIITHTMVDGTTRASIEGYPVPGNEKTITAYNLLAKWIIEAGVKKA